MRGGLAVFIVNVCLAQVAAAAGRCMPRGRALSSAALRRAGPSQLQAQGGDEQARPAGRGRPLRAAVAAMQREAGPWWPPVRGASSGSAGPGPSITVASEPAGQHSMLCVDPCTGHPSGCEGTCAGPGRWCCCCGRTLPRCWWTRGACRPAGTPLAATRRAPAPDSLFALRPLTLVLLPSQRSTPAYVHAWYRITVCCRVTVCLLRASRACC